MLAHSEILIKNKIPPEYSICKTLYQHDILLDISTEISLLQLHQQDIKENMKKIKILLKLLCPYLFKLILNVVLSR